MISVVPKGDWVLVKQHVVKVSSGIVLPDNSQMSNDLRKNVVVAIGEKVTRVGVGEEIVLIPRSALSIDFPERDVEPGLMLVREEFVIASLKEEIRV